MVAFKNRRRGATSGAVRRRLGPVLLAIALGIGGSGLVLAAQARDWSGAEADAAVEGSGPPPGREALKLQRAQAWIRLNGTQRSRLFASLRTLESRDARDRVQLLTESERCLERAQGVQAVASCQAREHTQRRSLKKAHHAELAALMQSYGLPLPPHRPNGMGWQHNRGANRNDGQGGQGGQQTSLPL